MRDKNPKDFPDAPGSSERGRLEELLRKYDRRGPRYTSYPAAPQYSTDVRSKPYASRLRRLNRSTPLSLYVHIPFCEYRCDYCGCFVIPTLKRAIATKYLDDLAREAKLVVDTMGRRPSVSVVHLGGGTPTYLQPAEIDALFASLREAFDLDGAEEISVELDPRVTTERHLEVLHRHGVHRVSLGVQDTSPAVQGAIGRHQSLAQTSACYERCRQAGFDGVNVDFVYGLPLQTRDRFTETLEDILALSPSPDRLAVYGFFQNEKKLSRYFARLDRGELPTERGYLCTRDDLIRRFVILELLCNQKMYADDLHTRFGVSFGDYFSSELARLHDLESDGLVRLDPNSDDRERSSPAVGITLTGRLFLRNVAMVFDRHVGERSATETRYSRTI